METLFSPAHLHLALNHVPIIGMAVACLPVLIGILFHSRGALASGLLALILCVGVMPAIMQTGESAQESFADGSIDPGMDEAGKSAFREHSHRADTTAPIVYATGILALLSILMLIKYPRQAAWMGWAVLIGGALSIGLSVWTAEAGGRIRHSEFRPTPRVSPSPMPAAASSPQGSLPAPAPSPEGSPSGSPATTGATP